MTDSAPPRDVPQHFCPNCGQPVTSSDAQFNDRLCLSCWQELSTAPEDPADGAPIIVDDEVPEAVDQPDEADLSGMRIRQVSALRRGAYRTRSWLLIGAIACGAGAAQLIFLAVRAHRNGHGTVLTGDLLVAFVALLAAPYFLRRAMQVNREIRQSAIEEPSTPPDFSTLSDGSQRWTNLQAMTDDQIET
jgi:hypothetical protein